VGAWEGVSSEARSGVKREPERFLNPVHSVGRFVTENLAEFVPSVIRKSSFLDTSCRTDGVFVELFRSVRNLVLLLAVGTGTIDTGGSLRRVST